MSIFTDRFGKSIAGVLSALDRAVFRGFIQSFVYPRGMFQYLCSRKVLLKDFTAWAKPITEEVKSRFTEDAAKSGHEVTYIRASSASKEEMAREAQEERQITRGIIGSWSCVEPCRSWTIFKNRDTKRLETRIEPGQCLHLYRYWDHEDFGFMHVRLQTWFPFSIQICMNGREYLRRQLERLGIGYQMRDNCFTYIEDWKRAQTLSDRMLELDWPTILDRLSRTVFPARKRLLGNLDYQWSAWQSEWATDHAFSSKEALDEIYPSLERHALLTSRTATVLRYLGRHVTERGLPHGKLESEVTTRLARREEGTCIKHQVGSNGVKMYNKQGSVLRVETTINDPRDFKVFRPVVGSAGKPKCVPIRKSVVDLKRRAEASQKVNERYLDHQASASTERPLGDITEELAKSVNWNGERMRGMDLTSKDRAIVDFLCNPAFAIRGMRNADLCQHLKSEGKARGRSEHQISSKATRTFRLLRAHGLIRKMPKSHRYQITEKGVMAITTVKAALCASAKRLSEIAA
jgi:hypothetical protein